MFTARRTRRGSAITMLVLVVVVFAGCGWPQARYGPEQTGFNPFERAINAANVSQLRMRWSQYTHSRWAVTASPVIADATLYIGTDKLYAFDANTGSARWSSAGIGIATASPAVDDGAVYVNAFEGDTTWVRAFDATTGEPRWSRKVGNGAYRFSPTAAHGVVYVNGDGLTAFDAATGATLWSAGIGLGSGLGSPAIANGVVYVSGDKLYAFDAATGSQRWSAEISPTYSPAVANGVVYVSGGANLYALSAVTGAQLWTANTGGGSPAAIADGVVYVSGDKLYAFDAVTGSKRWAVGSCCGAPVVANGVIYVGSDGLNAYSDSLNAYDAATGNPLFSAKVTGSSPVVANGVVYFGDTVLSAYSLPVTGPQLSISPAFPDDFVFGDPSSVKTFTITNLGTTPTSPIVDSLAGPDAARFRLTTDNCAGITLAGGAHCTVIASFAPTRSGPHVARLTSTATAGGTVSALLAGTAQPLTLAPSNPFAYVFVGLESTAVFTVTNLSGLPVGPIANTITAASEFTITADTCAGKTMASGTNCTIGVNFAPTWSTEYSGKLVTQASAYRAEAQFSGTGRSRLTVTPPNKDFGTIRAGTSTSATFTVTNISTTVAGPLSTGIMRYGGLDWLSLGSDTCAGRTLAANTSCTVVVGFAPTGAFPLFPLGMLQITAPLAGAATASLSGGAR